MSTIIPREIVDSCLQKMGISNVAQSSIREMRGLINNIEEESNSTFIRLEMGVPGLRASQIGIDAQIEALKTDKPSIYPPIEGTKEFKHEASRFCKMFLDIDIDPKCCIPTVGSMQAGIATLLTVNRMYKNREGTLFIDPGFPVQKTQCEILGQEYRTFDVFNYRGAKLREKLEEMMIDGRVSSLLYSNPNNPAWFCLTDEELQIIADVCRKYNVIVIEDLAYFAMDFRKDYGSPGIPPFQPTIAKYYDNYILFISSSKCFSYAGERMAFVAVSTRLWNTIAPDLLRYHKHSEFGRAFQYGTVYALSAGTSHSAQIGYTAMLKAANDGKFDFVEETKIYGKKAKLIKQCFVDNGFYIVYDKDGDEDIADGFYFTVSYPNFKSGQLLKELLYYGISAVSLGIAGSNEQGMRVCVSMITEDEIPVLCERLAKFNENHS